MKKRTAKVFAMAIASLFVLSACSGTASNQTSTGETAGAAGATDTTVASSTGQSSGGNHFTYVIGTEPLTMDTHLMSDANTGRVSVQIHENLVKRDLEGNFQPVLATEWSPNEDATEWTFKLREGVTFHDGEPFNAEAVKYNIERLKDPATGSPKSSLVTMISDFDIVNDYEIKFILDQPCAVIPAMVSTYSTGMMSPKALEEYGKDYSTHAAGTGPLKLKEWIPGTSMSLEKNESYWGKAATAETIDIKIIAEDSARAMMLKTGDADVAANIPSVLVDELQSDPNVEIEMVPGYRTIYLGLNFQDEKLANLKVREAIDYAIDRDAIINGILGGYVTYPSTGVISSSIQNAKQGIGDDYKYDPEKAKQLLAEAGYPDGFTTKINTPEGRYAMDRQVAEAIQAMLSQVGITAEVNVLDWGAYTEAAAAGDTEIFLLGKGCATGDLAQDLMYNYRTGELQNYTFYSNPEYDKVCEEQQRTADENARKELLYKMQDIIHEDRASIILYYENQTFGTRADVSGLVIFPNETIELAYLARK